MKNTLTLTPELYNLLTADLSDEDFTVEELLQMIAAARKSVEE